MKHAKILGLGAAVFAVLALASCTDFFGSYSNPHDPNATDLSVPGICENFSVTKTESNSVTLAWTENDLARGYRLFRSSTQNGAYNLVGQDLLLLTQYKDSGLSAATEYWYKIQAFNAAGNSALSTAISATTLAPHTLTYNGNGNDGGNVPLGSTYYLGDIVTVSGNTGLLEKSGYAFIGWNTSASGNGTSYSPGADLTMPDSDVILYALWQVD